MIIVSITGKEEISEEIENETIIESASRKLVEKNLAEWWFINPMTQQDIADWIPLKTSSEITLQLFNLTKGNPRWVQTLWRSWRVNENVIFDEERQMWRWTNAKSLMPKPNLLKDTFESRLKILLDKDEISKVKDILYFASLEGRKFTSEVISRGLELDNEYLGDLFDDKLVFSEDNPNGVLLDEKGLYLETELGKSVGVYRYSFLDDWDWQVMDYFAFAGEGERHKYSLKMIDALENVYETNEHYVAKSLSQLCKFVGDDESAKKYQHIADYTMQKEKMRELALLSLKVDTTDWDKSHCGHFGRFLYITGAEIYTAHPHESLSILLKANEVAKQADDLETQANALYQIAWSYNDFGKFEIAKENIVALAVLAAKLHSKLRIAQVYSTLGAVARNEARFGTAELSLKKHLAINKNVFGENHPSTATSYNNLALLYYSQGRYEEAEPFYLKALEIRERVLGENHPSTATSYNNLGVFRANQEKYAEAKVWLEKALVVFQNVLGNEHPDTIRTKESLEIVEARLR